MNAGEYEEMERALQRVMRLLAAKEYDALIASHPRSTISAEELRNEVAQYGRTIIAPPFDDGYRKQIEVYEKDAAGIAMWEVEAPIWTAEEGYSDLTLSVRFILGPEGPEIVLRNLHVL